MINDTICARVTTSSGQYYNGVVEHPLVAPASYRPSMVDQLMLITSSNSPCGVVAGVMWSNMRVSHSAISNQLMGSLGRHAPSLPVSTPSWANLSA